MALGAALPSWAKAAPAQKPVAPQPATLGWGVHNPLSEPAPKAPAAPPSALAGANPIYGQEIANEKSGLAQKLLEYEKAEGRDKTSLTLGTDEANHAYEEALRRATQTHAYTTQDIGTATQQAQQNHALETSNLVRQYQQLATNQTAKAEQLGNGEGGALAAALIQRGSNQGLAQSSLDTNLQRELQNYATRQERADQAYSEGQGTAGYSHETELGKLGLQDEYDLKDIAESELNDKNNATARIGQLESSAAYSKAGLPNTTTTKA